MSARELKTYDYDEETETEYTRLTWERDYRECKSKKQRECLDKFYDLANMISYYLLWTPNHPDMVQTSVIKNPKVNHIDTESLPYSLQIRYDLYGKEDGKMVLYVDRDEIIIHDMKVKSGRAYSTFDFIKDTKYNLIPTEGEAFDDLCDLFLIWIWIPRRNQTLKQMRTLFNTCKNYYKEHFVDVRSRYYNTLMPSVSNALIPGSMGNSSWQSKEVFGNPYLMHIILEEGEISTIEDNKNVVMNHIYRTWLHKPT